MESLGRDEDAKRPPRSELGYVRVYSTGIPAFARSSAVSNSGNPITPE